MTNFSIQQTTISTTKDAYTETMLFLQVNLKQNNIKTPMSTLMVANEYVVFGGVPKLCLILIASRKKAYPAI